MKGTFQSLSNDELYNVRGGLMDGEKKPPPEGTVIVEDIDIWIPVVL
jgi:hypothetical protein